jgi:hypothetical protein
MKLTAQQAQLRAPSGRISIHRPAWVGRPQLPRTGSSLIAGRGAGTPSVVHAARAHGAPGGEADRRSRRRRRAAGTRPGHRDAVSILGLYPGQVPDPGTSSRTARDAGPLIIQRPGPRQAARPRERHGGAGRPRFSSPARWLPGAPAPCPGVTLSHTGGQGERAHCRSVSVKHGWKCSIGEPQIRMFGADPVHWCEDFSAGPRGTGRHRRKRLP